MAFMNFRSIVLGGYKYFPLLGGLVLGDLVTLARA